MVCACVAILQMPHLSSRGKKPLIDLTSSSISKRTRQLSTNFDNKRSKALLDSQSFNNNFKNASTIVARIVRFDKLGSTFAPKIFADKDQASLFGGFEYPIEEQVKEFYSNAWFTRVELKCWVCGKYFVITLNYLAKIRHINRRANLDTSPYDDRLAPIVEILETLGTHQEVFSTGISIGTSRFKPKMKNLTMIMHSNLYPFTNTGFINLGRAKFLCDLINGAQIDICAHIFQILGRIAGQSTARTYLPFCSLIMKIMTLKSIHPPKDGMVLPSQGSISLYSLQSSKVHSSTERAKKSPSKPLKSGSSSHASSTGKSSAAPSVSKLPETSPPHTLEPQPSSTHSQPGSFTPHVDRIMTLMEGLHECISRLANIMHSHNNHVQLRLITIETQLNEIQCKLKADHQLFVPKRGRKLIVNIVNIPQSKGEGIIEQRGAHVKRGSIVGSKEGS